MPPRRRREAVKKNSRMAAAVEHMAPMGFEESLVISTVKELLEIYTEDGWLLIEDNYYSVLRDTLLEKTASPPHEEEQEPALLLQQASPPQEEEQEPALLLQQEGGGDCGIVVAESSSAGSSSMLSIETQKSIITKGAEETEGEAPSSPPPLQLEPPPQRTRKPYYGWISKDGSEDREIIELPSMPLDVFEEKWSSLPLESDLDLNKP